MAEKIPTPQSFQDRYATDVTFQQQIDESRLRRDRLRTTDSLKNALATATGIPGAKPKMY